jgi:hypothetical protein
MFFAMEIQLRLTMKPHFAAKWLGLASGNLVSVSKGVEIAAQLFDIQAAKISLFDIAPGPNNHCVRQAASLIAELSGQFGTRHPCYI